MASLAQPLMGPPTRFPSGQAYNPVVAPGSTDALPVADAKVMVTKAGVNAMTLAAPLAGVYQAGILNSIGDPKDDGKELLIYCTTAFAHTITTPANAINGNKHVVTFTAVIGNFIRLLAFNGIWYVEDSAGATLT